MAAPSANNALIPNPLHQYASFNTIFMLSLLSPEELNFPDSSYKQRKYKHVILRSGGGSPDVKATDRIETAFGKFDFFIDNVSINGVFGHDKATGNTNTVGIKFKIFEPYSMGLLMQAIQVAAMDAGYDSYIEAPLLLTIEFIGHKNFGQQGVRGDTLVKDQKTTKHIPMKISSLEMKVGARGAEYDIEAFPWNESGLSDQYTSLKTEVSIEGTTIGEVLKTGSKSLEAVINQRMQNQTKGDNKTTVVADKIYIRFPPADESSSLVSDANSGSGQPSSNKVGGIMPVDDFFNHQGTFAKMNSIAEVGMGFGDTRPGDTKLVSPNKSVDRNGMINGAKPDMKNPDSKMVNLKYAQGSSIENAINQTILSSAYGEAALNSVNVSNNKGKIDWWKIDSQVYLNPDPSNLKISGTLPRTIVYNIRPHKIDVSNFLPPGEKNPNIDNNKKNLIVKKYDYIYTGKNYDIIDFNIEFKLGFYSLLSADAGKNNEGVKTADESGVEATKKNSSPALTEGKSGPDKSDMTNRFGLQEIKVASGTGGAGKDSATTVIAKQFQDLVINKGADMISLSLTILGDPYYLGDGAMGNYVAKPGVNDSINGDDAIDQNAGEVDVEVTFRTPVDIDYKTHSFRFTANNTSGNTGQGELISQFSGLFQVISVESSFVQGKFTQVLKLMRRFGQDNLPGPQPNQASVGKSQPVKPVVSAGQPVPLILDTEKIKTS